MIAELQQVSQVPILTELGAVRQISAGAKRTGKLRELEKGGPV